MTYCFFCLYYQGKKAVKIFDRLKSGVFVSCWMPNPTWLKIFAPLDKIGPRFAISGKDAKTLFNMVIELPPVIFVCGV